MATGASRDWMWADACEMLARAERMQRQFFQLARSPAKVPTWEPPVDVLEADNELLILIALPGVDPDRVEVVVDGGLLIVAGQRVLPPESRTAVIHRLEIPQGRFERRIPLPVGHYASIRRGAANGCLLVSLQKA